MICEFNKHSFLFLLLRHILKQSLKSPFPYINNRSSLLHHPGTRHTRNHSYPCYPYKVFMTFSPRDIPLLQLFMLFYITIQSLQAVVAQSNRMPLNGEHNCLRFLISIIRHINQISYTQFQITD